VARSSKASVTGSEVRWKWLLQFLEVREREPQIACRQRVFQHLLEVAAAGVRDQVIYTHIATMPAATTSYQRDSSAGPDDLDNLLDYDGAVEDFWKDMPEANGDNANETSNAPEKDMDEEVKVAKKRKPNPKLDQDRYE